MATDVEALCKILTDERIKQLLLSLQGTQHTEIESEPSENVNKEKMATYASVVSDLLLLLLLVYSYPSTG